MTILAYLNRLPEPIIVVIAVLWLFGHVAKALVCCIAALLVCKVKSCFCISRN